MKNKKNIALAMSAVSILGAVAPVFADEIVGEVVKDFNLDDLRSGETVVRLQAEANLEKTKKHLEGLAAEKDSNGNAKYSFAVTDTVAESNGIKYVVKSIKITRNDDVHNDKVDTFTFAAKQVDQDFGQNNNDVLMTEKTVRLDFKSLTKLMYKKGNNGYYPEVVTGYGSDANLYAELDRMIYDLSKSGSKITVLTKKSGEFTILDIYAGKIGANPSTTDTKVRCIELLGNVEQDRLKFVPVNNDFRGHWAESNIVDAMIDGIIDTSSTFRPQEDITRAEFAKIACNAFGLKKVESPSDKFTDVNRYEWYAGYIEALANAGYVTGDGDGTFRPMDKISRQESAKIIAQLYSDKKDQGAKIEITTTDSNGNRVHKDTVTSFADDANIAVWADESVEYLAQLGISNGYEAEEGKKVFKPADKIRRAEALVMMTRDASNDKN